MAGIDTTSPHYKGKYASIYEVNVDFPNGGSAGDYVDIQGFAHYWNADRNNWLVNQERDEYWDELLLAASAALERIDKKLTDEITDRENSDEELWEAINNIPSYGVNERIEAIQSNLNTVSNELSQEIAELNVKDNELAQTIATETDTRERAMTAMAKNIIAMIDEERHLREEGDTPIIMTEEEYNAAVESGEITETDTTIRYIVE